MEMTPVLNVKLAEEDWSRVLTYLSEFPFKNVANLMAEIQKQLMAQVECHIFKNPMANYTTGQEFNNGKLVEPFRSKMGFWRRS
jgi:hypothetical protein